MRNDKIGKSWVLEFRTCLKDFWEQDIKPVQKRVDSKFCFNKFHDSVTWQW